MPWCKLLHGVPRKRRGMYSGAAINLHNWQTGFFLGKKGEVWEGRKQERMVGC